MRVMRYDPHGGGATQVPVDQQTPGDHVDPFGSPGPGGAAERHSAHGIQRTKAHVPSSTPVNKHTGLTGTAAAGAKGKRPHSKKGTSPKKDEARETQLGISAGGRSAPNAAKKGASSHALGGTKKSAVPPAKTAGKRKKTIHSARPGATGKRIASGGNPLASAALQSLLGGK